MAGVGLLLCLGCLTGWFAVDGLIGLGDWFGLIGWVRPLHAEACDMRIDRAEWRAFFTRYGRFKKAALSFVWAWQSGLVFAPIGHKKSVFLRLSVPMSLKGALFLGDGLKSRLCLDTAYRF